MLFRVHKETKQKTAVERYGQEGKEIALVMSAGFPTRESPQCCQKRD